MAKKQIGQAIVDDETGEVLAEQPSYITVSVDGPMWKTPFNHDRDAESLSTGLVCLDPSKTQQQFAKEADINNILQKFMATGGTIAQLTTPPAELFRDLETEFDLQDQMVTAHQVEEAWNALPIQARAILQTPQKFLEWYDHCIETGNIQGLRDIGMIPPETPAKPPEKTAEAKPPAPPEGEEPPAPPLAEKGAPRPKS